MSSSTISPMPSSNPRPLSAISMFFSLLVPVLALFYVYWRVSRRHMINLAEKIPGPKGLPILGNALEFIGNPNVWVGPRLLIFITDPRDVEVILSSHVHIDKSPEYRFFKPWLGDGLLISTGQKWRTHRKLIAPTFHLNVLKSFIDLFNKNSRETVEKMKKEVGKEFDCHDYMSEATVEMLLETAMGVSKKTQDQSCYDYAMAVMKLCDILHLRHTKIWLRPDILFNLTNAAKYQKKLIKIIHSLTRKVIQKKKADFLKGIRGSTAEVPEELKLKCETKLPSNQLFRWKLLLMDNQWDVDDDVGEKKRMAFLDLMIEASQNGVVINDEEIKEQEIDEIFQGSDRPATFADTLEIKYLERCLLETLRLFPPVPIIARQLQQDVKLASNPDHVLPAGATIVIGTFKIHRLEEIYGPNPEKFDPDNFLPEKAASRHYNSFIPFSAGPRSCVGHYKIKSNLKETDYKLQADIILKRTDGFKVILEKRQPIVKS
ncbi:hypothetical protein YQE_00676, partial [Dendroctonus ponderosae]